MQVNNGNRYFVSEAYKAREQQIDGFSPLMSDNQIDIHSDEYNDDEIQTQLTKNIADEYQTRKN